MDIIASEDFSSSIMSSVQGRSIYLRLNKNMRHLKLDQVFHNTILGPSLAIWVCQIYQFLQKKTEGIFQKTNPLKFQKSYLKFHTLFSLIITIFLLKKSSLQGKKKTRSQPVAPLFSSGGSVPPGPPRLSAGASERLETSVNKWYNVSRGNPRHDESFSFAGFLGGSPFLVGDFLLTHLKTYACQMVVEPTHLKKYVTVKLDHLPEVQGEHKKIFETTT